MTGAVAHQTRRIEVIVLLIAIFAVFIWLLVWRSISLMTPWRLDRLHRKVSASRIALDEQLVRRAAAADALAGLLDPAAGEVICAAARAILDAPPITQPRMALAMDGLGAQREHAESALTAALRPVLLDPAAVDRLRADDPGRVLVDCLAGEWFRARLARRFHNEAVAQAHRARRHWYVRWFHLAGHAPWPQTVEFDDQMPPGLDASPVP